MASPNDAQNPQRRRKDAKPVHRMKQMNQKPNHASSIARTHPHDSRFLVLSADRSIRCQALTYGRERSLPTENTPMFYLFNLLLIVYMLYVASNEGGGSALRKGFLLAALLWPTWMTFNLRSIRLDFRIIQAIVGCALLVGFPPRRKIIFQFCLADAIVFALFLSICVSQYLSGGLAPLTAFDIAFTWLSTYVVGRLFLQSPEDLKDLVPIAKTILLLVCVLALVEAFSKMNPVNTLLGKRFGILESGEGYRWGLKRAQGNVSHPIYNGFQLILFLPLALEVARCGWRSAKLSWLSVLTPVVLGAAIIVTVSRGAQLGYLIACGVAFFLMVPRFRIPLAVTAVTAALALYSVKDVLVDTLGQMAGENTEEVRMIEIDGEEVEYTGTKHRLLLLQVYRRPLEEAGFFGWGGAMAGVKIDPELEQRFGSIDSHYVLFHLQYGRLGNGLLIVLMLLTTWYGVRAAWTDSSLQPLAAGLAAGFVSLAISMTSVWFAPDYAAIWLFNAGLVCNVRTLSKMGGSLTEAVSTVGVELPDQITRLRRRLIPVTHEAGTLS